MKNILERKADHGNVRGWVCGGGGGHRFLWTKRGDSPLAFDDLLFELKGKILMTHSSLHWDNDPPFVLKAGNCRNILGGPKGPKGRA